MCGAEWGLCSRSRMTSFFSASVYQEISFGILNLGADEETARKKVEQVIRELGICPFQDRPAHGLSGGQKKLVAIADILVMEPEVMILDEPAASPGSEAHKDRTGDRGETDNERNHCADGDP